MPKTVDKYYGEDFSNATYVETLYFNILGSGYEVESYNYWLGALYAGNEARHELLLEFTESDKHKALFTTMTELG